MHRKSLLAGFAALATTLASFAWFGDVADARQKRTLIIYSGRSEKLIGPLIKQARKDLNLDIKVRYGKTSQLAIALLEEGKNSRADLFFAQDAGALGALERRRRTLPIPIPILRKVPSRYRSPWGNWMGISGRARVIDYNTKLVRIYSEILIFYKNVNRYCRVRYGFSLTHRNPYHQVRFSEKPGFSKL